MRPKPDKICELHGEELVMANVPIRYGYPAFDGAWEVKDELFPNAPSYALGGCVIDLDDPKSERMPVCPECRRAEKKWREENADVDPLL